MTANAFACTFAFFSTHRSALKNAKEQSNQRTKTLNCGQARHDRKETTNR